MSKIKIGIFFGGSSKEREISFAGGRTVYDNLNKSLFEAIPVFVDSFNNFILLNWEFIYKGSIRDFYPPVENIPSNKGEYQIYTESIDLDTQSQIDIINKLGKKIKIDELKGLMDFAFLALHGPFGEDGKIQGLLDYLQIPFSGSGILPSAIGIDKAIQKKLMINAGFNSPAYFTISRKDFVQGKQNYFKRAAETIGFPLVVKAANQGSSIGVNILMKENEADFNKALNRSFFMRQLSHEEWNKLSLSGKFEYVRSLADIREGIGAPVKVWSEDGAIEKVIKHPNDIEQFFNSYFSKGGKSLIIESLDAESEVIVEGFIEGKEFSCIVVQDEEGHAIALPPTEIRKGKELFDYRSKYLPGLSRKITPINLPEDQIEAIRKECERLFGALNFGVYARIDGFIKEDGTIYLNDPNTTSGMMPSSFFFHQAAEIGLNPSQFLTYIIRTSLSQRCREAKLNLAYNELLMKLDEMILRYQTAKQNKKKIAVILGGYSSERHISVESGRNIYEKLSSSEKYHPVPVFLTGGNNDHQMYVIPINLMLKDNADDIKEKVEHYSVHPIIGKIVKQCESITEKYSTANSIAAPQRITYKELANLVDGVFIALHGRPGEDGALQIELEKVGLPYNGSDANSSAVTINKYQTNEILHKLKFHVAKHNIIQKAEWLQDKDKCLNFIEQEYKYPFICKPVDDGCSSAVKKIKNKEELLAFADLIFRDSEELNPAAAQVLQIKPKEEFPNKNVLLIEELISKKDAGHFLEITGGLLTHFDKEGKIHYEVFEASEALSEGDVLSLEEKFLAGQGQNLTPARYAKNPVDRQIISDKVKRELELAARALNVTGYCRIDAFVRVFENNHCEVIFVEVNSLPGMTPATCIFHQTAIQGYKPYDFIDQILEFGFEKKSRMIKA